MRRTLVTTGLLTWLLAVGPLQAADLTIASVNIQPGMTADLVVSGSVAAESTFGVTILVEIIPQAGTVGTITFTPAPPVDIVQLGDPWPGIGSFSPFDVDFTTLDTLNGSVDDNGTFVPGAVTFSGALSRFPIIASANASGVWDVVLVTSSGSSTWEGLTTTLVAGTITVFVGECILDGDCNDGVACTDDTCVASSCVFTANNANCADDGLFCNGTAVCDLSVGCVSTGDPCTGGLFCNETTDTCDECLVAADCTDLIGCTDAACVSGACVFTPNDANCPDDGLFCNGSTICDASLDCVVTGDPCMAAEFCNETTNVCDECMFASDCDDLVACTDNACVGGSCVFTANDINCVDDGLFCNGAETCDAVMGCVSAGDPCAGGLFCNETLDSCDQCLLAGDCVDSIGCTDATCVSGSCVFTPNDANCPPDLLFCNGTESCDPVLDCVSSGDPCSPQICNELTDTCTGCTLDVECGDGNPCTSDVCNAGFCENMPQAGVCDDGDPCTAGDTCAAGACVGSAVDCSLLDDACNLGVCTPSTGVCVATAANEGGVCDDGVSCTTADSCTLGVCGGVAVDCSLLDDACNIGVCNAVSGLCDAVPANGGGACDDSDLCTTADACVNGTCSGVPVDCTGLSDSCNLGVCNATTGVCEATAINNGALCDDGLFCTATDSCNAGVCVGTGDPCPLAVCDENTNACVTAAASLTADSIFLTHGTIGNLIVSGQIAGFSTFGVSVFAELIPRPGNTGSLVFTTAPPTDIVQLDDVWPTLGTFSGFDTDTTGASTLNGFIDDNGTFVAAPVTFAGMLVRMPVAASADAGGVWDVVLATSAGNSTWEGVATLLNAGTITVAAPVGLTVSSLALPPGATASLFINGNVDSQSTFGVNILVELLPRTGAVGTLTFTPAPPADILQLADAWPGRGGFTAFDTDTTGSATLNGSVDDNGSFIPELVLFDSPMSSYPVVASAGASGVWDVVLATSGGVSSWEGLPTVLIDGTVTVTAGACVLPSDCDDGNVCTIDVCNFGICEYTTITGACDDGDPCTLSDVCVGTTCAGSPRDCSGLTDFCNVGVCNGVSGLCEASPINDGFVCDDGDACTSTDTCSLGVCAGVATDCTLLDGDCTLGTCNAVTGICEAAPVNEAGLCSDGDPCTDSGACASGTCVSSPVDCTLLDDDCNVGVCNALTGICEASIINELGVCDDGDPCVLNTTCALGVCGSGTAVDCSMLGDQCNTATCDPIGLEGNCTLLVPFMDGTICDDGLFCTVSDTCVTGACTGVGDPCPGQLCDDVVNVCVDCFVDLDCDDGNPCTNETCVSQVCNFVNNTQPCDDASACTIGDSCFGGSCQPGLPVSCGSSGDQCNNATCDPLGLLGNCSILTPVTDGTACNDGLACDVNDQCSAGVCSGTPADCSALSDACNVGTCNGATGACFAQPANDGIACNDGLPCTTGDACSNGSCVGTLVGTPAVDLVLAGQGTTVQLGQSIFIDLGAISTTCADQPVASLDTILNWDPTKLQLVGFANPFPSPWLSSGFPNDAGLDRLNEPFTGLPANDGDALWQGISDFAVGTPVPPTGLVATTFEFLAIDVTVGTTVSLVPTAGVFSQTRVLGAAADAGVDITGSIGSALIQVRECIFNSDCDDANPCTDDTCVAGVCVLANNTSPCDDGQFCTVTDQCSGGACIGTGDPCPGAPLCSDVLDACVECLSVADCDDSNGCTDEVCSATGVCQRQNNVLVCDDGLFCTTLDVCSGGSCVGSGDPCPTSVCAESLNQCVQCLQASQCDDGNLCTDDLCSSNVCVNNNNAIACDDGLFCTSTDQCSAGACVGSNDPCTSPLLCDENFNACVTCIVDIDCDDGNLCTTDSCSVGVCTNALNTLPCDDGVFCTANDVCSGGVCTGSGDSCPGLLCDETGSQCVECFNLADCTDDGVGCTIDRCTNGACVHDLDDTACDDGLFCNGAEFCHPSLDCVTPGNPCDAAGLCDETNDLCNCQTPTMVAEGPRYLAVTPAPGVTPIALRITGISSDVACVDLFVQSNGILGVTPVFQTPNDWGTVHVRGSEVRPSTTYSVQADCDPLVGQNLSPATVATTWQWGDSNNSGGLVDITDITLAVDGFQGLFRGGLALENVDIWGSEAIPCRPQRVIDIFDLTSVVGAFSGFPFGCTPSCP